MSLRKILAIAVALTVIFSTVSLCAEAATFNVDVNTTSDVVYLLNMDTNTVVYEKNSTKKAYPASTTKIMTYIVTVENVGDLNTTRVLVDDEVLATLDGTGSSLSGLQFFKGTYVTVYDLLQCMMIKSGNDAALLLANYIGEGSIQKFVDLMNQKAEEIGCKNTHFTNPHGLHDENHYTTAEDMAIMTQYAQTLPEFNEIANATTAYLSVDQEKEYPLITTNYMIDETRGGSYYYPPAKGIKTGTTDEAGYCLVSTASGDGYTYMCIVFGSPCVDKDGNEIETNGAMVDSKALYKWAFENLEIKTVVDQETPICEIPVKLAWDQDTVLLVPQGSYSTILPANIESSSMDVETNIPESLTAPIIEGTVIGTATISYANQELTTVNLIAGETVERSKILHFLDSSGKIIHSQWMILSIAVVVLLFIIYAIITLIYNNNKKKKKNMKQNKGRSNKRR